jgi:hypothetical protein
MKNRPPGPSGLKALEKTVVIKGGPQAPNRAPVPPAKGAPVPPPPLWNYEGKPIDAKAEAPKSLPTQGEASTKTSPDAKTPGGPASATAPVLTKEQQEQEAQDLAAIIETNKAMDELYEQVDLLEAMVAQLPK